MELQTAENKPRVALSSDLISEQVARRLLASPINRTRVMRAPPGDSPRPCGATPC
jgi:hypothetical protein